jgi:hypothetical protein
MQLSAGPKGLGQVATGCRLKVNDDSSRDLAGFPRFYSAAYTEIASPFIFIFPKQTPESN